MYKSKLLLFTVAGIFFYLTTNAVANEITPFCVLKDSTFIISFEKALNSGTISKKDLRITRRFFNGTSLEEKELLFDEISVQENHIELRMSTVLLNGIIRISYEPGKWEFKEREAVQTFSITVRERNNLVEDWDPIIYRRWVGSNLWANRLQDWEIMNGILECNVRINDFPMPMRTVHAITQEVSTESGNEFFLSVRVRGMVSHLQRGNCMAGFLIGAGRGWSDYRAGALVQSFSGLGGGILGVADYQADLLTFRDNSDETNVDIYPVMSGVEYIEGEKLLSSCTGDIQIEIHLRKEVSGSYNLILTGWDIQTGLFIGGAVIKNRPVEDITGSFALVAHPGQAGFRGPLGFIDFRCWGSMSKYHAERQFGPIVGTLYSLNKGVMKMTVQFMPVACPGKYLDRFPQPLVTDLEYRIKGTAEWKKADMVRITQPEYMAHFRVENWDASEEYEYRVLFQDKFDRFHHYNGTIRKDPVDKDKISFIALTGMGVMGRRADSRTPGEGTDEVKAPLTGRWAPSNLWFPHSEIVSNIKEQDPDLVFFTGDQIYENNPTKPDRRDRFPVFDYLYKWYLWYWSFREVTKDRPSIFQIDDHDVIAGNVWGHGGELNLTGRNSHGGGYMMDPLFIQIVERTQCMHNPDGYRFTELMKNSFSSYFGSLTYGGVSFAILEDRKFKTPPPKGSYQPKDEILLGEPQLRFLDEWLDDWANAYVKVVVSQSTYASTHTDWGDEGFKDYDTGGYPKAGRDRALEAIRKARALIVCGDQHLATITRMGIEEPGDAALQFCVPAVGNIYWRWFFPDKFLKLWQEGEKKEIPDVSGDYRDEFGNYFRMITVANPDNPNVIKFGRTSAWIPRTEDIIIKRVSKGDGYGRVIIDKVGRSITLECYPYDANIKEGDNAQFPGWPYTILFNELDGRTPIGYLPELQFVDIENPVVRVIRERDGETVYVIRVWNKVYSPPVFEDGKYSVRVFDAENTNKKRIFKGLEPSRNPGERKQEVKLL